MFKNEKSEQIPKELHYEIKSHGVSYLETSKFTDIFTSMGSLNILLYMIYLNNFNPFK
jgi:hypothetical protein